MRLSKLQRFILETAAQNSGSRGMGRNSKGQVFIHCYIGEIIRDFYGFNPSFGKIKPGSQNFNRYDADGYRKIRSARSAISRAVGTLVEKNLVDAYQSTSCRWAGVAITERGLQLLNDRKQSNC